MDRCKDKSKRYPHLGHEQDVEIGSQGLELLGQHPIVDSDIDIGPASLIDHPWDAFPVVRVQKRF